MKYVLALISEEGGMEDASPEEMKAVMDRWDTYTRESVDNGAFIAGEALQPSGTATTVKIKEGEDPVVTDGPFAESKEQLGGFCLLECADLEEALDWANKVPIQPDAGIEVRPIMDLSGFGYESATVSPVKAKTTA
jgi:hypothetical protein